MAQLADMPRFGLPTLAVAVSGGPDSFALMHLLHLYTRGHPLIQVDEKPRPRELVAITIDHQLRSESAHEASLVGQLAHRLGEMGMTAPVNACTALLMAQFRTHRHLSSNAVRQLEHSTVPSSSKFRFENRTSGTTSS